MYACPRPVKLQCKPFVIAMTNSATSHLLPVFARVAVNALGHCHPHLIAALQEQSTRLWHMSNLFKSPDGEKLAARLCEQSFADLVFF